MLVNDVDFGEPSSSYTLSLVFLQFHGLVRCGAQIPRSETAMS